jgi:hypothetical protein
MLGSGIPFFVFAGSDPFGVELKRIASIDSIGIVSGLLEREMKATLIPALKFLDESSIHGQ